LLAGFDLGKPLICAVNGHARAGGFDLMLASEIRYAVPHATFALEEVALGLYPTGNATVLLPKQVGWVHAHELLLSAQPIDAERALAIGLVNRVVPEDRCIDEALAIARSIAANDLVAVRLTKQAINRGAEIMGMRQGLLQGLELGVIAEDSETPESREFNEILEKEGAKAALAWQEARLARETSAEN
jgi:enoyl-CoA hydratase